MIQMLKNKHIILELFDFFNDKFYWDRTVLIFLSY